MVLSFSYFYMLFWDKNILLYIIGFLLYLVFILWCKKNKKYSLQKYIIFSILYFYSIYMIDMSYFQWQFNNFFHNYWWVDFDQFRRSVALLPIPFSHANFVWGKWLTGTEFDGTLFNSWDYIYFYMVLAIPYGIFYGFWKKWRFNFLSLLVFFGIAAILKELIRVIIATISYLWFSTLYITQVDINAIMATFVWLCIWVILYYPVKKFIWKITIS